VKSVAALRGWVRQVALNTVRMELRKRRWLRFFTTEDSAGGRLVCAVGATVVENLFPTEDPLGKQIRIGGRPFTVVGVFEKQGGLFGEFTTDTRVFVPLPAFESAFGGRRDVTIQVRVADMKMMEDAKIELEGIMRNVRRLEPGTPNDFNINQQEILTETFGPISLTISVIGLFVTGLSLFVGGIGIMNIMFVSVTERTKEIGIRKAIGARERHILFQFIIESVIISGLGGVIGLGVGVAVAYLVPRFGPLTTVVEWPSAVMAMGVAASVGIFFGFYPAWRAARLDPIEALRYE
jgi:putative ABC transport system permease protein